VDQDSLNGSACSRWIGYGRGSGVQGGGRVVRWSQRYVPLRRGLRHQRLWNCRSMLLLPQGYFRRWIGQGETRSVLKPSPFTPSTPVLRGRGGPYRSAARGF